MNEGLPEIMTTKEVADYLRIHLSTVFRMVRTGQLPGFRVGAGRGDYRFRRSNIEKLTQPKEKQG